MKNFEDIINLEQLNEWVLVKGMDKYVKTVLTKSKKDPISAVAYAYSILEDINGHTENEQMLKELGMKWAQVSPAYGEVDVKFISKVGSEIEWGLDEGLTIALMVLEKVGYKKESASLKKLWGFK